MPIQNLVTSTATIDSFRALRPGFGKPAIVDILTEFEEQSMEVATKQELLNLGFSSSDAVVAEFEVMTSQEARRPRTVTFTLTGTGDGAWTIPINGVDHTFSASSSTADQIRDGLIGAINGGDEPTTAGSPGSGSFTLTADVAGQPFLVGEVVAPSGSSIEFEVTTPNHGVYDDLQAIKTHRPTVYGWSMVSRDSVTIMEASRWVEGETGILFAQSDEAGILDATEDEDLASALLALERTRTVLCYKSNDTHYFAEAWMGRMLPANAGAENWAWQPIRGVLPDDLQVAEVLALEAKRCNWIENIGGRNYAYLGMTSAPGMWADLVRGRDKVVSDVTAAKIDLLGSTPKLDYDALPVLASRIEAAINQNAGFVVTTDTRVTLPDTVPSADVSNREVNGITWTARLRVPINKVTSHGILTIGTEDLVISGAA
jgi:hypothetical protein